MVAALPHLIGNIPTEKPAIGYCVVVARAAIAK